MSQETAIALPFNINAYGKVNSTVDQRKIWADRVRSVIGTSLRERLMRPTFGTIIPFALFEGEGTAIQEVETEVEKAFNQQLPLLRLEDVAVTGDATTSELMVEVTYRLPNDLVVNTNILVGLVVLTGSAPIYEELL